MRTVLSLVIIGLLGLWLLATVVQALPFGAKVWRKLRMPTILFSFIPRWSFFAPNPGTYDHFLLCWYQFEGGAVGVWRHLTDFDGPRTIRAPLWNPGKRLN